MSSLLLPPILVGSLPGYPVAPTVGPLDILIYILLIPGLIAVAIVALGMGGAWLKRDKAAAPSKAVESASRH